MTLSAEQYPFLQRDPTAGPASLAPIIPLILQITQPITVMGLLDTGATVNVLPYAAGVQLGADWDALTVPVQLTGNLAAFEARALVVTGMVGKFAPVRLAFAWAKTDTVPVLLGQVNFFLEFDVCFYRSRALFEVRPKA